MKKFEQLGRVISKEEQKNLVGGVVDAACVDCGGTKGWMCGDGRYCAAGDRSLSCQGSHGTTIYIC